MNFDLLTAVLKSELPCAQRMILTVVLNHAGQDNRAWPSHPTIAAQAGLAERSVWAHLRDLEASGWLLKVGNVGRVVVWEVKNPANSAGLIPQPLPEIPQILPDAEKPIPQILRDDPANSAGYPANSASLSRKNCELTNKEPHKNHTRTNAANKSPGEIETPDPRHRQFIQAFATAYQAETGLKYVFQPREAKTLKTFLASCPATVDEMMSLAEWAWKRSKQDFARSYHAAATIHDFLTNWQRLVMDRKNGAHNGNGHRSRNQAFDQTTLTLGKTAEQIGTF